MVPSGVISVLFNWFFWRSSWDQHLLLCVGLCIQSINQSIYQKRIRVTKVTNLLRDHYCSAIKLRIVEIKKVFNWCWNDRMQCWCRNDCVWLWVPDLWSGNRKSSAADGGKFEIRYFQPPGDPWWQSGVLVDQVCRQHEWVVVVPSIAARYCEELCSSV